MKNIDTAPCLPIRKWLMLLLLLLPLLWLLAKARVQQDVSLLSRLKQT